MGKILAIGISLEIGLLFFIAGMSYLSHRDTKEDRERGIIYY